MHILLHRSLWSEYLPTNPIPIQEQKQLYTLTSDDFIITARWFIRNDVWDILMIYDPRYNRWSVPGGKIDAWMSYIQALTQEIYEELGVHIDTMTYIWGRKTCMRGTKWLYKRCSHYRNITIHGEPKNNESSLWKWEKIWYVHCEYNEDRSLKSVTCEWITYTDKETIYDMFPWLHTLVDVLPYMPLDIEEVNNAPYIRPSSFTPESIYTQRYDTQTKTYFIT